MKKVFFQKVVGDAGKLILVSEEPLLVKEVTVNGKKVQTFVQSSQKRGLWCPVKVDSKGQTKSWTKTDIADLVKGLKKNDPIEGITISEVPVIDGKEDSPSFGEALPNLFWAGAE
jgi:hypothetical protein